MMLMANERTQIERPIYSSSIAPDVDLKYHGHKGFNWRILESKIRRRFAIRKIQLLAARRRGQMVGQPDLVHLFAVSPI